MPVSLPLRQLTRSPLSAILRAAPAAAGVLALTLFGPGCRSGQADSLLGRPVPPPPEVTSASPVLWVSLEDHLGRAASATPLMLESASGALEVRDRRGRLWRGRRIRVSWRQLPLAEPLVIERQVLGPFASFESAEQAARSWRALDVPAQVAHPGEWEVWAPVGAPAPGGTDPRLHRERVTARTAAVLEGWDARAGGSGEADDDVVAGPLQLSAPGGLRWRGGVFRGPFRLQPDAYGSWTLVEQVPLERYLKGVVPHEIGASSPLEAQAAQAVLARTWALSNSHRFRIDGYHLCSDTQCQVYKDPRQAGARVTRAIEATAGQVLTWQGRPIHAVYHASNGGIRAGFQEAWSGSSPPYLTPAADGTAAFRQRFPLPLEGEAALRTLLNDPSGVYGQRHPLFRWSRRLDAAAVGRALASAGRPVGRPEAIRVVERGPSGRVLALAVEGSGGSTTLRLDAIRRTLRTLPSTLFVLEATAAGQWRARGGGFGHGAGLSQAGAMDLARRGWNAASILDHYYPGTRLESLGASSPSGSPGVADPAQAP